MAYPAYVIHPSFIGRSILDYDVIVDYVELHEETTGDVVVEDWAFRGHARRDGWNGKKTFFAAQCRRVIDGKNGEVLEGRNAIVGWLQRLVHAQQAVERERVFQGEQDGILAQDLGHDVIVRCPVLSTGEVQEFRVTIKTMSRWSGTIRFHGAARRAASGGRRAWTGEKSFYMNSISSLVDPETGPVADIESYLVELARAGTRDG